MKGLRVTPQERFDGLRNELETRIFVQTKLDAIRQNPIVSELLFFSQFTQVNSAYLPDSIGTVYSEPESISHAIRELHQIIDDISELQSIEQAVIQCFEDSNRLQGCAQRLICSVDEIRRIAQYLTDELLRFPEANLQIYQIAQDVACWQEALDLLAYSRFASQVPEIAEQVVAAGDSPGGALLLCLSAEIQREIDFERLGVEISSHNALEKMSYELRRQLTSALFLFTAFNHNYLCCVAECPNIAIHELIKRLNTGRTIISRQCHTLDKIMDFMLKIDSKSSEILVASEFTDENFISPDMIPENAELSIIEYVFILAESVNMAVDDQQSFFEALEREIDDSFIEMLNEVEQQSLEEETKAFMRDQQIKLDFPQFSDKSANVLANLAISLPIPELSEKEVNSTIFLRIFCSRVYYVLQNAFYFDEALKFTKREAARVDPFEDFIIDGCGCAKGIDLPKLAIRAFRCFLELVRSFCVVDPGIIIPEDIISFQKDEIPLFSLQYIQNIPEYMQRSTKLDIETLYNNSKICALAAEQPIYAMFSFFSRIGLDRVIEMEEFSQEAKTVIQIHSLIFDSFYKFYVSSIIENRLSENIRHSSLFMILPVEKRLCIEEAWQHINKELNMVVKLSEEGRIREQSVYENIVGLIVGYTLDFQNTKLANLHSFAMSKRFDQLDLELSDIEIHNRMAQQEDFAVYERRLSRGNLTDTLINQELILLSLDDFEEILYIKTFLNNLWSEFKDVESLRTAMMENLAVIVAEFRLQLYYHMFRIKEAIGGTVGHCTLMYDLERCLVNFKNYIDVPHLFSDIFNSIFGKEELTASEARELFDIVKVLNAYVGGLEGIIEFLTKKM